MSEARIRKALDTSHREGTAGTDPEDILLRFTDSVVRDVKAPRELFDAVLALLSARGITELLMTIGTYMMVSRVLENLEIEIEQDGVDIAKKAYYPDAGRP